MPQGALRLPPATPFELPAEPANTPDGHETTASGDASSSRKCPRGERALLKPIPSPVLNPAPAALPPSDADLDSPQSEQGPSGGVAARGGIPDAALEVFTEANRRFKARLAEIRAGTDTAPAEASPQAVPPRRPMITNAVPPDWLLHDREEEPEVRRRPLASVAAGALIFALGAGAAALVLKGGAAPTTAPAAAVVAVAAASEPSPPSVASIAPAPPVIATAIVIKTDTPLAAARLPEEPAPEAAKAGPIAAEDENPPTPAAEATADDPPGPPDKAAAPAKRTTRSGTATRSATTRAPAAGGWAPAKPATTASGTPARGNTAPFSFWP